MRYQLLWGELTEPIIHEDNGLRTSHWGRALITHVCCWSQLKLRKIKPLQTPPYEPTQWWDVENFRPLPSCWLSRHQDWGCQHVAFAEVSALITLPKLRISCSLVSSSEWRPQWWLCWFLKRCHRRQPTRYSNPFSISLDFVNDDPRPWAPQERILGRVAALT